MGVWDQYQKLLFKGGSMKNVFKSFFNPAVKMEGGGGG